MIRRILCWFGWHEWCNRCDYPFCKLPMCGDVSHYCPQCRGYEKQICKYCGKVRDEIYNFSGEESMIRRILCWLGWHDWRYVIKFEKMCSGVIWYDKPYLDGKVCKHCGKVKR